MANFFKGIEGLLKHPIDEAKWMLEETKGVVKPLLKGDFSESFDSFKGSFGRHNDMMSENITVPLMGHNKISENPDAAAGAVLGTVFAAPAIMGAAQGGGASAAGAQGTTFNTLAGSGFRPGQAIQAGANSLQGAQPSTWNNVTSWVSNKMDFGTQDLGKLYQDVDFTDPANDELLGMIADTETEIATANSASSLDWGKALGDASKAVADVMGQNQKGAPSGGGRAGFRGANIPAAQYSQHALGNQMAGQAFNDIAAGGKVQPLIDGKSSKLDKLLKSLG